MRIIILVLQLFFTAILSGSTNVYKFRWNFKPGKEFYAEKYTIQQIIKNGRVIANRDIKDYVELLPVEETNNYYKLKGKYLSYLKDSNGIYKLLEGYNLDFKMNSLGEYIVPDGVIMPSIRNIPVFPTNSINIGDEWDAIGVEVLEFKPFITLPVEVHYKFNGFENKFNKRLAKITYSYLWDHTVSHNYYDIPYKFKGLSESEMWYNLEKGLPEYVENRYNLGMIYKNGNKIIYRGILKGYYNFKHSQKEIIDNRDKIYKKLKENKHLKVKKSGNNVVVDLGEVYFKYNKSELTEDAKKKLDKIGKVLRSNKNISILIKGHTDNIGSDAYNKKLSTERAKSVLKYLINKKYINPDKGSYKGVGEKEPIESNDTESGRAKNRRVEIIIIPK